ncbi:MAG: hypothetical protein ACRDRG_20275 [Pseudonocardiaceae bacterium]
MSERIERIEWVEERAHHIRTRSQRYPGATDIEPEWTVEVVNDPDRTVGEPDTHSAHANSVRVVGYSETAAMVITVVAIRDQQGTLRGASAWPTTGSTRREYWEGRSND